MRPRLVYSDQEAAELYEALNPWCASDDFYLALVMEVDAALDVGCGPGGLLRRARLDGHTGRLCGVDPDAAALALARQDATIEWVQCTAAAMKLESQFELVTMTGHAFQSLVTDEEVRMSLEAIHRALVPGGRFAFETRNPAVEEWKEWSPDNVMELIDPRGQRVRVSYDVESVVGDVITLTELTEVADGRSRIDRASLRFLAVDRLAEFLGAARFEVEEQSGDWDGSPSTRTSREVITVAKAA